MINLHKYQCTSCEHLNKKRIQRKLFPSHPQKDILFKNKIMVLNQKRTRKQHLFFLFFCSWLTIRAGLTIRATGQLPRGPRPLKGPGQQGREQNTVSGNLPLYIKQTVNTGFCAAQRDAALPMTLNVS